MAKRKTVSADKPPMPAKEINVTLQGSISAKLMHDFDRYSNGTMLMTVTSAKVSEDGKELGEIRGGAGAPVLQVIFGRRAWLLSTEDIFRAVLAADKEWERSQS